MLMRLHCELIMLVTRVSRLSIMQFMHEVMYLLWLNSRIITAWNDVICGVYGICPLNTPSMDAYDMVEFMHYCYNGQHA
jgi:hypothetical protein